MTTRISHRKGGETEFKEITDKPQYMSLDSVVPPKVEEYDPNRDLAYQQELESSERVDGNFPPPLSDEL